MSDIVISICSRETGGVLRKYACTTDNIPAALREYPVENGEYMTWRFAGKLEQIHAASLPRDGDDYTYE